MARPLYSLRRTRFGSPVAGEFYPPPKFWNPETNTYEERPPSVLPGQTIGVVFYGKNTSGTKQNMKVECNGRVGPEKVVEPGFVTSWEFTWQAPQEPGDIMVTAKLYAEEVVEQMWVEPAEISTPSDLASTIEQASENGVTTVSTHYADTDVHYDVESITQAAEISGMSTEQWLKIYAYGNPDP